MAPTRSMESRTGRTNQRECLSLCVHEPKQLPRSLNASTPLSLAPFHIAKTQADVFCDHRLWI